MTSLGSQKIARLLVTSSLALALGACGGGGSTKGAGGNGGSSGPSGGGGSGGPSGLACMSSSIQTGTCTQAEIMTYTSCIQTTCDGALQTCYGAGYKTGEFGGVCGTYQACAAKCGCSDTACRTACGSMPVECTSCLTNTVVACAITCAPPCLFGGGAGGASGGAGGAGGAPGGSACVAALQDCCDAAPAASKTECLAAAAQISAVDAANCTAQVAATFRQTYCSGSAGGGGASGSTTGACADLLACCGRAAATFQTACMAGYSTAVQSGDAACASVLSQASAICP